MATLYDKDGTKIYTGRGNYSRKARSMIEGRTAYTKNEDGELVVYIPDSQAAQPPNVSTLHEDARILKNDAQRLGRQLGMGLDEIEVRRDTSDGVLVAHLKQLVSPSMISGLDPDQAAKLVQILTQWMLRRNLTVYDHEELVRNLHQLVDEMRGSSGVGSRRGRRGRRATRESSVNVVPGLPTSNVYNELWVHAFLPPKDHRCRPSVTQGDLRETDVENDGRVWNEPALHAGMAFVCPNLEAARRLATFTQGKHGIVRVFLPEDLNRSFAQERGRNANDGREHIHGHPEPHLHRDSATWEHCLQRFIDACAAVKNSVRPDLRLLIHRGDEPPQEVTL